MVNFNNLHGLQAAIQQARSKGLRIGFVPTMGNLHAGHISLVELAKQHCDFVVVSIFVNPLQFSANEDLETYPRTLSADQDQLRRIGTDALFLPSTEDIYPLGLDRQTSVSVPELTSNHCGHSRPGHFDGVTTVVNKLLNIVQADIAVFGQKDFQQLAVIRKMVKDLCMPVKIIAAPTARANDGLALSSRNQYLNENERKLAPTLFEIISSLQPKVESNLAKGAFAMQPLEGIVTDQLIESGFKVDYLHIVDANTLAAIDQNSDQIVILVAAFLGSTRLIDNLNFFR